MLGPFFDRGGRQLSPEVWERLTRENAYTVIAAEMFDESSVVVRTRWLGHDPEAHEPPQIFHSKAIGDGAVPEVLTATEAEAIAVHKGLCARYKDQAELLANGGARLLSEGVL